MRQEMECMCQLCGASSYLFEGDFTLQNSAGAESKLLDSLNICQICGGQLVLVGKVGDQPHYKLE